MTYPISNPKISEIAKNLDQQIHSIFDRVTLALSDVAADNYKELLALPKHNVSVQSLIAEILAFNVNSAIVDQLSIIRGATVTISDVNAVASAFDALCTLITNNESAFEPSFAFNPSTKDTEFTDALSAPVKSALTAELGAVLATMV